ncbi:MAG TPA: DUF3618 domain-containing protein, partial [Streptomyces sp.]|nr:DUF3618 domain-containing protein [Streptomyces sp.]
MSSISEDDDRAGQSGHADDKVDDAQDARVRVEQARERLGETVEQLAAKADVKARTQVKAAEVKDRTQVKAAEVKDRTQVKAAEVKDRTQV